MINAATQPLNPGVVYETNRTIDDGAILKRIAKAKTKLILDHPFIGSIALNMPMTLDVSIPTACTNGKFVKFNPYFVDDLTDEEITFLVAHECFHPMLGHIWRLHGRDPKGWNVAGDYVINQLLTDDKIGKMIEGGLLDKTIYDAGDGNTDKIYANLPESSDDDGSGEEPKYGPGQNKGNGIGNDIIQGEGTPAEQQQEQDEWQVKVAQAAQSAKIMGKLSVTMERFANELLNPKVDWRDVLRRFVEKCKCDERNFARPNRRFIQQGLYLPTVSGEQLGEVAFAIDCSGSINQEEIDQFAAEITAVKVDGNPSKLHILYFHSQVCKMEVVEREEELPEFRAPETGGTAFSPIFKALDDAHIDPVACVVLTDLYCNDYGPMPDYPVLWVSNYEHAEGSIYADVPFGEVVMM